MFAKVLKATGFTVVILGIAGLVFAQTIQRDQETLDINVDVPVQNTLDVTASEVVPAVPDDIWTVLPGLSMDFGQLSWDDTNHIFTASKYFAVDVGINSNASSWRVDYQASPFQSSSGDDLNDNVNVTFAVQSLAGEQSSNVRTYGETMSWSFLKSAFGPGEWLRVYYGIATGCTAQNVIDGLCSVADATNAVPVGVDKSTGAYTGSIVLTLYTD